MKEAMELFGLFCIIALLWIGAVLFIAAIYGAIFGTIGGVLYLFIKAIVGLFT